MKKKIFLSVALVSVNLAFAQTNPTAVNAKEKPQAEVSAAHQDKAKAENHDHPVAGAAKSTAADAAAAARAKASKEESNRATDRSTGVEVKGQVGKAETPGAAVAAVAQGTPAQGQEKGQEVKEVATTNQKEKPAKVEVEEKSAEAAKVKPTVRRGGASRAAGAARAAGAVNAREAGAAARGAANGAAKPAKVNTNGASARPVQVGGAVKVNNRVKLRN